MLADGNRLLGPWRLFVLRAAAAAGLIISGRAVGSLAPLVKRLLFNQGYWTVVNFFNRFVVFHLFFLGQWCF